MKWEQLKQGDTFFTTILSYNNPPPPIPGMKGLPIIIQDFVVKDILPMEYALETSYGKVVFNPEDYFNNDTAVLQHKDSEDIMILATSNERLQEFIIEMVEKALEEDF